MAECLCGVLWQDYTYGSKLIAGELKSTKSMIKKLQINSAYR